MLRNFLIQRNAEKRKFYRVLNSIAESPIRKEIFIIAEQRQFFRVLYGGIAMLRTQKFMNAEHKARRSSSLQDSS